MIHIGCHSNGGLCCFMATRLTKNNSINWNNDTPPDYSAPNQLSTIHYPLLTALNSKQGEARSTRN